MGDGRVDGSQAVTLVVFADANVMPLLGDHALEGLGLAGGLGKSASDACRRIVETGPDRGIFCDHVAIGAVALRSVDVS